MSRLFVPLAALALLVGMLATPVTAAPLGGVGNAADLGGSGIVQRVHGWHRYCAWGPARYHRHVPGVGNVRCGRGHYRPSAYYGGAYIGPRHYRRSRRPFVGHHVVRPRLHRRFGGGEFRAFRGGGVRGFHGGRSGRRR